MDIFHSSHLWAVQETQAGVVGADLAAEVARNTRSMDLVEVEAATLPHVISCFRRMITCVKLKLKTKLFIPEQLIFQ